MSGHRANKTFNHANLFFLPKVEGCPTPDDLRPLMIGNTDTRLISNAIRSVLTPAVEALLSPIQGAKLSSLIDDNIIDMNHNFYQGDARQVLFLHDFAKAFDSISRSYLTELLKRIGVPEHLLNLILTSFVGNVAFPILQGRHKTKIPLSSGVKQGDPLFLSY